MHDYSVHFTACIPTLIIAVIKKLLTFTEPHWVPSTWCLMIGPGGGWAAAGGRAG